MTIKDETYFQFESGVECGTLSVIPNSVYKPDPLTDERKYFDQSFNVRFVHTDRK